MLDVSRRSFIGFSSGLLSTGLIVPGVAAGQPTDENPELIPEDELFRLLNRALDVASSSGASYAEVSLDRRLSQGLTQREGRVVGTSFASGDGIGFGVRVLFNGCWGHAASNQLEDQELVRVAEAALNQARANAAAKPRNFSLGTTNGVSGRYVTPGIDPFSIPLEEKIDFLNSWRVTVMDYKHPQLVAKLGDCFIVCSRTERGYVNSEGSRQYSVTYYGRARLALSGEFKNVQALSFSPLRLCRGLHEQQAGWDMFRNAKPHEQIPELVEDSARASMIGMAPVDVGRYDLVCDSQTTAFMLGSTVVRAAELDRALGYEANSSGTSYLGPNPFDHLGSTIASPSVSITANRHLKTGLATIPWDSEGIPVKEFDLVKNGQLVDYFTNREVSPMLQSWYEKKEKIPGSNGCSVQANSRSFPLTGLPNIKIMPPAEGRDEEVLISEIKKGYYLPELEQAQVSSSFQCQDGYATGLGREIINGKLGNYVRFGVMFNVTELLKGVAGIGAPKTQKHIPFHYRKGQPAGGGMCTFESVPIAFSDVAVINPLRKG